MNATVIAIIETRNYYKLELKGKAAIYTWTKFSPNTKEAYGFFKESRVKKTPLNFVVDAFSRDICSVDNIKSQ